MKILHFNACLNSQFRINGSRIVPYLLEKSRLTNIGEGERNFHIFYQFIYGMKDNVIDDIFGKTKDNNLTVAALKVVADSDQYRYVQGTEVRKSFALG